MLCLATLAVSSLSADYLSSVFLLWPPLNLTPPQDRQWCHRLGNSLGQPIKTAASHIVTSALKACVWQSWRGRGGIPLLINNVILGFDFLFFVSLQLKPKNGLSAQLLSLSKTHPFQTLLNSIHSPSVCVSMFFVFILVKKTSRAAPVLTLIQCSLKARVVRSESDGSFTLTLSVPELERAFGKKFKSKTKYKKTQNNKKRAFHTQHFSAQPSLLQTLPGSFPDHKKVLSLFRWLLRPFILISQASFLSRAADEFHLFFFFWVRETSIRLFFLLFIYSLACLTFTRRRNERAPASFCPTSSILTSSFILRVCFFSPCCHSNTTCLDLNSPFVPLLGWKAKTLIWFQSMRMIAMMMTFYFFFLLTLPSFFPPSLHLQSCPLSYPPPPPTPIPNHSKKEKAWGRAHLPQMSDECVATRDPHSSPPPSVLPVYRHPQSLIDDVPSRRFRFRYLKFGVILWTFFYFTDVCVFLSCQVLKDFFKKIDGFEAFGACKKWKCCVCFLLSSSCFLISLGDAGPPNGHGKLFAGLVLRWMNSLCSCCKWAAHAVAVILQVKGFHWRVVLKTKKYNQTNKKMVLNFNLVFHEILLWGNGWVANVMFPITVKILDIPVMDGAG